MLKGIDAVIFDLDGTLIDSMWMWRDIDIEYLGRYGKTLPDDLQSAIEGMSFTETAQYCKNRFELSDSVDKIKSEWNIMAEEIYRKRVTLKTGAEDFLKFLKKRNIKTGIATSNSNTLVTAALEGLNITRYFDSVNTACEVCKGKPAPDIYLYVANKLNVSPGKCLVFEDIIPGIMAGKNAGMRVCAVEDDFSRTEESEKRRLADCYIKDYTEIDTCTK